MCVEVITYGFELFNREYWIKLRDRLKHLLAGCLSYPFLYERTYYINEACVPAMLRANIDFLPDRLPLESCQARQDFMMSCQC